MIGTPLRTPGKTPLILSLCLSLSLSLSHSLTHTHSLTLTQHSGVSRLEFGAKRFPAMLSDRKKGGSREGRSPYSQTVTTVSEGGAAGADTLNPYGMQEIRME